MVQPPLMMIRFGDHELDEERYWLRFRGERLAIRPKVFDLLVLLVRHRRRVVLRRDIVLALWGTTAVGPGSLSGLVNELRQVLGEGGRDPSLIRTVHARGYQFIGLVEEDGDTKSAQHAEPLGFASNDFLPHEMASIRTSLERVTHYGARAVLVHGPLVETRGAFFASAGNMLLEQGYRICRMPEGAWAETSDLALLDRVLTGLVEYHGIELLRSKLPPRAHELFERGGMTSGSCRLTSPDPLVARQYQGRILRSTVELLKAIADECPLALVFDRDEFSAAECTDALPALLDLLGPSRIFILAMAAPADATAGPVAGVHPTEATIDEIEIQPEGVGRLNVMLAARGIEALSESLAAALVAHVRRDSASLESIVHWLRSERNGEHEVGQTDGEKSSVPRPPMRRVGPGDSERRSGIGS